MMIADLNWELNEVHKNENKFKDWNGRVSPE